MPDDVDELILKMQHLAAQARAQREAEALAARGRSLKSRAQQIAWAAQAELTAAEAQQSEGEAKLLRARDAGLSPTAAADLLEEGRRLANDGHTRVVKARAKLNFALDQMDEADRREYEALRAEARAEAHAQMADDPLFKGASTVPAEASAPAPQKPAPSSASDETKAATPRERPAVARDDEDTPDPGPRKTLGPRRRKGT
ncbi:MAG TPA: hypothetical protein VG496_10120 [Myxococcales bacterium]|nr:hypothetical protein [Myxococcales bacterium]